MTKATTPNGSVTRSAHEIVVGYWGGETLTQSQTTIVDPRCSVKLYERDARGLITSILEDYGAPHGDTGQVAQTDGGWRTVAKCDDPSTAAAALASAAAAPNTGDRFAETRYAYDALGQMSAVIMSRVRDEETDRITFGYDNLGRRIRVSDPDRGVQDVDLDGMGNVRSWTYSPRSRSASGNTKTVLQEFDANRLVETHYPATPDLDVAYRYDGFRGFNIGEWAVRGAKAAEVLPEEVGPACDNCMGRVVAVRDPSGLRVQNFDVFGQPIEEWRSIVFAGREKGLFDIHREYDRWGVPKSQRVREFEAQDPGARCRDEKLNKFICNFDETVHYAYNRAGQIHAVVYDNAPYARFARAYPVNADTR